MQQQTIVDNINNILYERMFPAIKKMYIQSKLDQYVKSAEFKIASEEKRNSLLALKRQTIYKNIESFYITYHSISGMFPVVQTEKRIIDFEKRKKFRIRADYFVDGISFSAFYPTVFEEDMVQETEDILAVLKDGTPHEVQNFKVKKDTERYPPEPLTNATIKNDAFYLYQFSPEYTTKLLTIMYENGFITDPNTNGWNIDDAIIEDIIAVLYTQYDEHLILTHKRKYTDQRVDRSDEAIRPIYFTDEYYPQNIKNLQEYKDITFDTPDEALDFLKLYRYIFVITLSTQMKNSIYDTSVVDIIVKDIKLRQTANVVIPGQENWEKLAGAMINKIKYNANDHSIRLSILPQLKSEQKLHCLNAERQSFETQRPPRYGVGRYLVQILEKYNIGHNEDHDKIIANLIDSKAITLAGNMIIPTDVAIYAIDWIEAFIPRLLEDTFLPELEEQIEEATTDRLKVNGLYGQFNRLIDDGFEIAGYKEDLSAPSEKKINFVKTIAKKNGLFLDESVFQSNNKLDLIIAKYGVIEEIKIGNCPACNAQVFQKEFTNEENITTYSFKCEKNIKGGTCNFAISDYAIEKYFAAKAMNLYKVKDRAETLTKILSKKKGYLFTGLKDKNDKDFSAVISMTQYIDKDKKQKWGFDLEFKRQKTSAPIVNKLKQKIEEKSPVVVQQEVHYEPSHSELNPYFKPKSEEQIDTVIQAALNTKNNPIEEKISPNRYAAMAQETSFNRAMNSQRNTQPQENVRNEAIIGEETISESSNEPITEQTETTITIPPLPDFSQSSKEDDDYDDLRKKRREKRRYLNNEEDEALF